MNRPALVLFVSCLVTAVLAAPLGAGEPGIASESPFVVREIYRASAPVYGLAAADLDPASPGLELAALLGSGDVLLLTRSPGGWTAQAIATDLGEFSYQTARPTFSIADVDLLHAGPEIVASVGQSVYSLARESNGTWTAQFVQDGGGWFGLNWGACAGDIDPHHAGAEVFRCWEGVLDFGSGYLHRHQGGSWPPGELIYGDVEIGEVIMHSAIGEFDAGHAGHAGNELVVTTEMGPTYALVPAATPGEPWPRRTLWNDGANAGWSVEIADIDPTRPGNEIAYGTRYLNRIMLSHAVDGGSHALELIFDGGPVGHPESMYDVATGRVLPGAPALQVVGVDFQGDVNLVSWSATGWLGEVIWRNPAGALYAAEVAELAPGCPQAQIFVGGESGAITLVAAVVPGDLNADGEVGLGDLATLLGHFGAGGATYEQGDVDRDGDVDLSDLAALLSRFGVRCA